MTLKPGYKFFILFAFVMLLSTSIAKLEGQVVLEKDKIMLVFSEKEDGPLKLALAALEKDIFSVMDTNPVLVGKMNRDISDTEIVIVNLASGHIKVPGSRAEGAGWI